MLPILRPWACAFVLICRLALPAAAQEAARQAGADEGALAAEFFATYARKDLAGLLMLWSAKAPESAAFRQRTQQQFAAWEKIEASKVAVRRLTVDGTQAKLRVEVELSAVEAKLGKPATGMGKMLRALECARRRRVARVARGVGLGRSGRRAGRGEDGRGASDAAGGGRRIDRPAAG